MLTAKRRKWLDRWKLQISSTFCSFKKVTECFRSWLVVRLQTRKGKVSSEKSCLATWVHASIATWTFVGEGATLQVPFLSSTTLLTDSHFFLFFLIISLFPLYPGAKSKAENKASLYVSSSMKYDNLCKCNIFSEGEIDFPLGCHCGIIHHFSLLPEWRGGKVLGRRSEAAPKVVFPHKI